jgi:ferritin
MISKTVESDLNKQINRKLFSEYLYLPISSYFETVSLKGFAKWMRVQDFALLLSRIYGYCHNP